MGLPEAARVIAKFNAPKALRSLPPLGPLENQKLVLQGWMHRKPKQIGKALTFAQLRDAEGQTVQLVDSTPKSILRNLKPDSVICVEGQVQNNEVHVEHVHILNEANLVPGQLLTDTTNWPGQYRYIQLRQKQQQQVLRKRAAIVSMCRRILEDEFKFVEVETPLLFKSTPEGAREFLVPTRRKGYMYALPQSPQQYKQLLIASGVDRYFQVAKCFRDEDLRQDRQPEFTQLDLEMGFASGVDVQHVIEAVVRQIWAKFGPSKLHPNSFGHLTYAECISNYGIDKPDLRSPLKIVRLPAVSTTREDFPVFEAMVISPEHIGEVPPRVHALTFTNDEELKAKIDELASYDDWTQVRSALGTLEPGTTVLFSDRQELSYENPTPLGRVRQTSTTPKNEDSVAMWVHKFPLFEPNATSIDDQGYPVYVYDELKSTHHPFTMVDLEDYDLLATNPLACHGQHYDLVIDGVEVGGGSTRVHDSSLQKYILDEVLKVPNSQKLFGHLIDALATGCPPHAGLAIGLDRFVAMLCGLSSVRDVIAFPKTMTGTDPVMASPSKVTKEQLAPYHIRT